MSEKLEKFKVVNTNVKRIEGADKACGSALYGADLHREGLLYMSAVYSSRAHARVLSINYNGADTMPGVVGIYGIKDVPGAKTFGILCPDQFVYAGETVYNMSDVICCVAAESQKQADVAAAMIEVAYEELPPVADMERAGEAGDIRPDFYLGNLVESLNAEIGDAKAAMAEAEVILEGEFTSNYIEHAYIEPEAVLTELDENGDLIVRGSIQLPFYLKDAIGPCLNLPMSRISVRRSQVGGSFGGKGEAVHAMAIRAGIVTLRTGRPVSYLLTRENSFRESHKRHPWKTKYQLGADKKGNLKAVIGEAVTDSGPYMMMTPCVAWKGNITGFGCYRLTDGLYQTRAMVTNNVNTSSMRGFGTPQALFAVESMMNELAKKLQVSPYLLRRQNALTQGEMTGHGHRLDNHTVSLIEALDKVAEATDFERKYAEYAKPQTGRYRKGIGIALSMRGCSSGAEANDIARARIDIDKDGSVKLTIGLAEIGQGLGTVMTQMCAEALQVPFDMVHLNLPNTTNEMDTGAAVGSRGTLMGGKAIQDAARRIKEVFAECRSFVSGRTIEGSEIDFSGDLAAYKQAVAECYSNGFSLSCAGSYRVSGLNWDKTKEYGDAFLSYTYNAQVSEVELDTYTGGVKVVAMTSCHDIGCAINPDMAEGQIQGGMVMSLGNALLEEFKLQNGVPLTKDYTTYLIPTMTDMPEMKVFILENEDPNGPFGAKSLAEAAVELGVASISGAVNQAMGTREPLRIVPMTPERVLLHMAKAGNSDGE